MTRVSPHGAAILLILALFPGWGTTSSAQSRSELLIPTSGGQIQDLATVAGDQGSAISAPASRLGPAACVAGRAGSYPCLNVDLVAFLPLAEIGAAPGVRVNDLWGWEDPLDGRRYVLLGREDGLAFIDITEPESPRYLGELPMTPGARSSVWRDVKVFGNHAFVVADGAGPHGMQVFDLTLLRTASGPQPLTFSALTRYEGFGSAHNVVINEESGFAYAVGSSNGVCDQGLHMIDVREPARPNYAGCYRDARTRRGYTHDAQCVVYRGPQIRFQGREICVASNEDAVSIVDVTDKAVPVPLGMATYPGAAYVHQGWFSEDQRLFFQDDELDERAAGGGTRTMVWDLTDLTDPQLVTVFEAETPSIDHNLYVRGEHLFQANYTAGLQILDISRPETPSRVAFFDTTPGDEAASFNGAWSVYPFFDDGTLAVSSRSEGLFLLRPTRLIVSRLGRFDALLSSGTVRFEWTMESQRDLVRFELERMTDDGSGWTGLAALPAGGTSVVAATFETNLTLPPGRSLIRLQAVSAADGVQTLAMREVVVIPGAYFIAEAFPNPAAASATTAVAVTRGQWVLVEAYNAAGALQARLFNDRIDDGQEARFGIPTGDWPPGTYFIRFLGETFQETRSLVVTR